MIEYAMLFCVFTVLLTFSFIGFVAALMVAYMALFGDLVAKRRIIAEQREKWERNNNGNK